MSFSSRGGSFMATFVTKKYAIQVAGALENSETLELSADKQYVKRKAPLVSRDLVIQEMDDRSALTSPQTCSE